MDLIGMLILLLVVVIMEYIDTPLFPEDNYFFEEYYSSELSKVDVYSWLKTSLLKTSRRWLLLIVFYYFVIKIYQALWNEIRTTVALFLLGIIVVTAVSLNLSEDLTIPLTEHVLQATKYVTYLFISTWAMGGFCDLLLCLCTLEGIASLLSFWMLTFFVHSGVYAAKIFSSEGYTGIMTFISRLSCRGQDTSEAGNFDEGCNVNVDAE